MQNNHSSVVWINGSYQERNRASLSLSDRGFLLGDGVFDTCTSIHGEIVLAQDHFNRLIHDASILNIKVEIDYDTWRTIARQLIEDNHLVHDNAVIRTTVTRGPGTRGLSPPKPEDSQPTIAVTVTKFDPSAFDTPAKLIIAKTTRRNELSPLSQIKSLNYGDNILARMEADKAGADDAIMLNTRGAVCCATSSNIYVYDGQTLVTPPQTDGVLGGITRQKMINEGSVKEHSIKPEELLNAEGVFISNSVSGFRAVQSIDGTEITQISIGAIITSKAG